MRIKELIVALEAWAPRSLQEDYDNTGLHVGDPEAEVNGALVCLDCTEDVVEEAARLGLGLIISHHPVIFRGLKSLAGGGHVERTVLAAVKHGIGLYAIHTNLDNVSSGVNAEIAARLGLTGLQTLAPKPGQLRKLVVFVPNDHVEVVRNALFHAGAGSIGAYDECSFGVEGLGSFRAGPGSVPFIGRPGERHIEPEVRVEVLYPLARERAILAGMRQAHPYEEVAYDLVPLANDHPEIGAGSVGELERPSSEADFLFRVKEVFGLKVVRHTRLLGRQVERVALCGGSGAFLIGKAKAAGADVYLTGDVKYHEFFDADGRLVVADIGHYGSEQFTTHLIQRRLREYFPTFAVRLTEIVTDPIHHF
ncbi:MAG TPA: Nif3-like dinuclear metal center hexameric protein [Flavobacteriales bacterium]|jgi:dinuclear metal center YbgI/SA1388 family protein|nr:Nif3-like dinuclear metal center hexameric protein [Flavobacteriales bacterium]